MKTVLKEGYERIIRIFYSNKNIKMHLREIARKAKMNENSAFRFLKQLENEKILIPRKDGNLKKYEIVKNDITYYMLTYFDITNLNSLPSIRRNAIAYFMQGLDEKPIFAVLFGSTAKNTFSEDSDIDLLLIVNKRINTEKAEDYADSLTAIKIKCLQIKFNEFEKELKLKEDKVVQSALNTGYPITNHIEYYRMIYNEGI